MLIKTEIKCNQYDWLVGLMMLNATFKNISVISWRSVLLVKETGVHRDLSQVTDKRFHIMYRVHLA